MAIMTPPAAVLQCYPTIAWRRSHWLGNRGGFSGARLWRLESSVGDFCLKAWPRNDLTHDQLNAIHQLLQVARQTGIDFVSQVLRTQSNTSVVEHDGALWDVSTWLPGAADFHARPTNARLTAAAAALARLHRAWQPASSRTGPCPVIRRRLATLKRWHDLLATGWRPEIAADDPVGPWAELAWQRLPRAAADAQQALAAWLDVPLLLHPCWCDPWHDHVLFTGDRVTGLIDYGSVKEDHAAIDLARLLGSFVGDDPAAWEVALNAYARVRPLTDQERLLVGVLERAGLVNALVLWLRWLYHERRTFEDRAIIAKRLQTMVARLDNLSLLP